jgi:archaemetzincin
MGDEPLGKPGPNDWLASHPEPGQTFNQFEHTGFNRPDAHRHTIYLQPLGRFGTDAPSLDLLRKYAAAFFMLEVKLLPPIALDTRITSRSNPYTGQRQLLTTDILDLLRRKLPGDAFCIVGITMEDLYPSPSWNFVFGQASLTERVGVYSFARYGAESKELTLRRSCKVLTHETGHMFGLAHCIWYRCVLNGSNHLGEADARPMHLCAVDLRKLQWSVGFDVVERYRRLRDVCREARFDDEAQWIERELGRMVGGVGED